MSAGPQPTSKTLIFFPLIVFFKTNFLRNDIPDANS